MNNHRNTQKYFTIPLKIENKPDKFRIDGGANTSIANEEKQESKKNQSKFKVQEVGRFRGRKFTYVKAIKTLTKSNIKFEPT